MKQILLYSFFIFAFFSCKGSKNKVNSLGSETEILAKSKNFISINTEYFTDTAYTFKHKEIPIEDLIKIKAIIYRIYSNIDLKNNMYILNLKEGSEINVSEDVYNIYKNNIEILNQEQDKVELPPVTKEYLNSLLID